MAKRKAQKPAVQPHLKMVRVDNPYYNAGHPVSRDNPRQSKALISMNESPALWLHCHKKINDAQFKAATRFRKLFEAAGAGSVKAIDFTKEPVDGGSSSDGITDHRMDAARELVRVKQHLGQEPYKLLRRVCGECLWIKQLDPRKRTQQRLSRELKASLTELAVLWGYAQQKEVKP